MKNLRVLSQIFALLFTSMLLPSAGAQVQTQGQWQIIPSTMPINPIHIALMHTGNVLVVAGSGNLPTETNWQAGVFTPGTGAISLQPLTWDMFCNGMVAMADGRILVVGGNLQYSPFYGEKKVSIFDPITGVFTDVQNMAHGRWYPSATVLADGRVMTFSGLLDTGGTNKAVEIYTPGIGWSPEYTATWTPPLYPRMFLLPNGKVFYAGAAPNSRYFDPATNTWGSVIASTNYGGNRTYGSSVLLPLMPATGYAPKVMIFGGGNPATATTELIDLSVPKPKWTLGPPMSQPRIEMNATLLPNGKILAVGGSTNDEDANTASLNADLYDPATNTFSSAGANAMPRLYHSNALLLPDATVLFVGGNPVRGKYEGRNEIYTPAYLFNPDGSPATRPTITSAPQIPIAYGATFQVQTPDTSAIASAILMRPGAPTHAFDMEQRLVGLTFSVTDGTTLSVTSPPNSNIAPPGYYLLFLLNAAGVPSVAPFVQLSTNAGNQPPTGTITSPVTDQTIFTGQSVFFAGSGSDPDGTIASYAWTFPGGTPASSTLDTPGYITYATPGTYAASLKVTDNLGLTDPNTPTRNIVVQNPPTIASLTLNPSSLIGGSASVATVTLSAPAPAAGVTVALSSSNPSVATVPASVTVAAGSTTTTVSVTTNSTATVAASTITASYLSSSATATLTVNPANPSAGGVQMDSQASVHTVVAARTATTTAFSTVSGNELLLAFVNGDYTSGANTSVKSVTGGGLTWVMAIQRNTVNGTAEIWRAFSPTPLSNVTVTATFSQDVLASMNVISFAGVDTSGTNGSGAIGARKSSTLAAGAPTATIVTTRNNSWLFSVGDDPANAIARTPAAGQTLVDQYLTSSGYSFWVQRLNSAVPLSGTSVKLSDTAPTGDPYNVSAVEILPAVAVAPSYSLGGGITPSGDGAGTTLTLRGTAGAVVTADSAGNYAFPSLANGNYTVTPSKAGFAFTPASQPVTVNGATVTNVNFTIQPSQAALQMDAQASVHTVVAARTATTTAFSTASGNELLLAFVNGDYTSGANTSVKSVTGGGLTWVMAIQRNTVNGTAEIWRAFSPTPLSNVTVTATFSQDVLASLNVISFAGVDTSGTNGSGAIGARKSSTLAAGAPTATIVTTRNNSWLFSVGDDPANASARTPAAGQSLVDQYLTTSGYSFWVQRLNSAVPLSGTSVKLSDTAPTGDPYNVSAVEILPAVAVAPSYSLGGGITPSGDGAGTTLTLTGTAGAVVTADSAGNYAFPSLANGNYTVTPSKAGFAFTPSSQPVTVNGVTVTNVNFTIQPL